ncbi:MAG: hypothetical protein Q8Q62_17835 [Mesorhizobium sp.]|nr:hypothetical protein [Mesorhizobium sp.]
MAIKFSTKDQSKPGSAVKETAAEIATRERVKSAVKPAGGAASPTKPAVDLFEDESEGASKTPSRKKSK